MTLRWPWISRKPLTLGQRGERVAADHLRRAGYRILARNLRQRFGEIDLIARPRGERVVAVVEVKTMRTDAPPPEAHVNRAKQAKLTALAGQLVRRYRLHDRPVRFDVVGVVWPDDCDTPTRITHHPGAFEATF